MLTPDSPAMFSSDWPTAMKLYVDAPAIHSGVSRLMSKLSEGHWGQLVCSVFILVSLMLITVWGLILSHKLKVYDTVIESSTNAPISHSLSGTEVKYSATSFPPPRHAVLIDSSVKQTIDFELKFSWNFRKMFSRDEERMLVHGLDVFIW